MSEFTAKQFFYEIPWMYREEYGAMWHGDANEAVFRFAEEFAQRKANIEANVSTRPQRQAEWTEEFGDHSECPVCGTACEMLFVDGK